MATYNLKKEWIGSTVTIFLTDCKHGYDIVLNEQTTQKQLQTLYNTEHPAVEVIETKAK